MRAPKRIVPPILALSPGQEGSGEKERARVGGGKEEGRGTEMSDCQFVDGIEYTLELTLHPFLPPFLPSNSPSGIKMTTSSFPSTRAGAEGETNSVLVAADRPRIGWGRGRGDGRVRGKAKSVSTWARMRQGVREPACR